MMGAQDLPFILFTYVRIFPAKVKIMQYDAIQLYVMYLCQCGLEYHCLKPRSKFRDVKQCVARKL
jgi:hypothetical protein